MQTFRASDAGLLRIVVPMLGAVVGLSFAVMAANRLRGPAGFVSGSLAIAGFAVLFGPQMMRLDLRGDLEHLDVLKTWPVRSSAVIRGQILWPACVVTAFAWIGVVCAAMFSGTAFPPPAVRLALGARGVGRTGRPGARRRAIRRAQRRRGVLPGVGAARQAARARRGCDGAAPDHHRRRPDHRGRRPGDRLVSGARRRHRRGSSASSRSSPASCPTR